MNEFKYPSVLDFIIIHDNVLSISGGLSGISNNNTLGSISGRLDSFINYNQVVDLHDICALVLDSLARNHAFVEGNKRTAVTSTVYTYLLNDIYITPTPVSGLLFEELVLWVVLEKPNHSEIRTRLEKIYNNYGQKL